MLTNQQREALLNEFAFRSFRDVADADYIAARMAFRARLYIQALWASQQALEKYIKAILLLRRIKRPKPTHFLHEILDRLEQDFLLTLSAETRGFIEFIDEWEADRYFIYSYGLDGLELMRLDRAVWEIRRYCTNYHRGNTPKGTSIEFLDLEHIERAFEHPPQHYQPLSEGFLDEVLKEKSHRARPSLIWQNLYFGKTSRRSIRNFPREYRSANSPLALYSDLLDAVAEYVYLPKDIRPSTLTSSPSK
jgi:HEPN domain-containing protein